MAPALKLLFLLCAVQGADDDAALDPTPARWALALHGGAGTIPRDMPAETVTEYRAGLEKALRHGVTRLEAGASGLDVAQEVVQILEDDPHFNAGKGAVFTHGGQHELDACIMDGASLDVGAVSGVRGVKNPIHLARLVLDRSRHVFLVGEGAVAFGRQHELELVEDAYFFTERRHRQWQQARERDAFGFGGDPDRKKGTVGCVVLDRAGNLAAATSTGGLTNKRYGRVGDVPIVGAGTYAKNATCAVSCTGYGEQFIRHTVAHDVSALMEYRGLDVGDAAKLVIHRRLNPGDGGLIAVSHRGEIALEYSSEGMFRGAASSEGRFEVAIWEPQDRPER